MDSKLSEYFTYVKLQDCFACGKLATRLEPSEVAHFKPVSYKLPWQFTSRTHKGPKGFIAIPLCPKCHQKQHAISEDVWVDSLPCSRAYLYAWIAQNIATFLLHSE